MSDSFHDDQMRRLAEAEAAKSGGVTVPHALPGGPGIPPGARGSDFGTAGPGKLPDSVTGTTATPIATGPGSAAPSTEVKLPGWYPLRDRFLAALMTNQDYKPTEGVKVSLIALADLWADHMVEHYPEGYQS